MNRCLILLVAFCCQGIFSQNSRILVANYRYENIGLNRVSNDTVFIHGSESLSVIKKIDSLSDKKGVSSDDEGNVRIDLSGDDQIGKQVYKNLKEGYLIFRDSYSKDGKLRPCIVREKLPKLKWNLGFGVESKKIGSYLCQLAKLNFRGRNYTVWYSTEIPISHGPWKFYGLPGLIVEITSNDGNIHFLLTSIRVYKATLKPIQIPNSGDTISFKDYVHYKKGAVDNFIQRLYAKLPRGATIKVSKGKNYSLETEFDTDSQ